MRFLFLTAAAIGILTVNILLDSWVLMKLWAWYIVPAFGQQPLSMSVSIGIGCVVCLLTKSYVPKRGSDENLEALGFTFLNPVALLLIGWLAK